MIPGKKTHVCIAQRLKPAHDGLRSEMIVVVVIDRGRYSVHAFLTGRFERMAPHVESTGTDGIYEVIDEVTPASGG
jgi:hypothetical protein